MIEPKHKNCIAERDWLRREYEQLKGNYDRVRAAFERQTIECSNLRAQLADANEIARQAVEEAKAARRDAIEQCANVADMYFDSGEIVDEIRALTESPLSPAKQAVIVKACDRLDEIDPLAKQGGAESL